MLCNKIIKWNGFLAPLTVGMVHKYERREVDYTKWLGPDYKSQPKPRKCATYVSNHSGICDAFAVAWALSGDFGFFGGAFIKAIPLVRDIVTATEGLFVPRKGTPEEKEAFV